MARRGRFGRRRTGSSNMTALITQLIREQRAAEDRVMFDAYQNGGLVDGKPVTDSRILAYIKQRRDSFGQDDPLYDEWNNRLIQYDFSIGESKIQLAFQQGKVGAGAVARYYRSQMSKIPKDSEFYREVAGRAAQWAKAAGAAARGRARGRATQGTRDKLNKLIYKVAEYEAFEAALTEYARRTGIISGNEKLTDADAGALRAMFDRGIYSGEDRITFDDWKTAAADNYKNLSGQVDLQVKLGNQGVTARNARDKFMEETLLGLNTMDEREQYEVARAAWLDDIEAAQGDPYAIASANLKYAERLNKTLLNASEETGIERSDPLFIGALQNEISAVTTGEAQGVSVAEMYGETGDLAGTAEATKGLYGDIDLIESGKAYFGQKEPGGPLSVVPFDAGAASNPLGLDKSLQPSVSTIGGQPRIVYLKGQPVTASVITDAGGNAIDPTTLSQEQFNAGIASGELSITEGGNLGYVFVNPTTGDRKYGVLDPATGKMVFTEQNPWTNEPINNGGTLTVFTGSTIEVGDKVRPDVATTLNPNVDLSLGDPLLSDSTVAPSDLVKLLDSGIPGVDIDENTIANYQMKLQKEASAAALRKQNLNPLARTGNAMGEGIGGGGGDLRSSILNGMGNIGQVTQQLFGSPDRLKDDVYVPPAPPKPADLRPPDAAPPAPTFDPLAPRTKVPVAPEMKDKSGYGAGSGTWAALDKEIKAQKEQKAYKDAYGYKPPTPKLKGAKEF